MTKFRDLSIGQEFDFIDDENPMYNSFYTRCVKTGARKYESAEGAGVGVSYTVGSINAKVYHVTP